MKEEINTYGIKNGIAPNEISEIINIISEIGKIIIKFIS